MTQEQSQERPQKSADVTEEEPRDLKNEELTEATEKLLDDIDAVLDEIETILEPNAEEFIRAYKQRPGQ